MFPSGLDDSLKPVLVTNLQAQVEPSPLASEYAFGTLFRANAEMLQRSREALIEYRRFASDVPREYPLRVVESRHTGLPALLNGLIKDGAGSPAELGESWFWNDPQLAALRVEALCGLGHDEARKRYRYDEGGERVFGAEVILALPNEERVRGTRLLHTRYQQWFRDEFPVLGGGLVVHGSPELKRASVSSSFLPISDDTFNPQVHLGVDDAIGRAAALVQSKTGRTDWLVDAARYFGQSVFVLPFVAEGIGRYALVYEIHLSLKEGEQAWRVFVDAETGGVVGAPEYLIEHAFIFGTSDEARTNAAPTTQLPAPLQRAGEPADQVGIFRLAYHSESNIGVAMNLNNQNVEAVLVGGNANLKARMQEAVNIAWHAKRTYEHFVTVCGAQTSALNQTVLINVGRAGNNGDPLEVGYNPAQVLNPKVINFQSDTTTDGNGLGGIAGKPIFKPSFDPEVIIHEVTHALMRMLKQDPFQDSDLLVPFASALREGYANYFGHSLGARTMPVSDTWASGSYPKTKANGQAAWGMQWGLPRMNNVIGEDWLAAPNLFPNAESGRLDEYEVGMILARALWDVRGILGADLTDKLALNALTYSHGIVTSFEQIAEGFIDSARQETNAQAFVPNIIEKFAERRVLAERGIQALAPAFAANGNLTALIVGTDKQVWRSNDSGANWIAWGQPSPNPKALGAVALAELNQVVYAAAEDGIYQRGLNAAGWSAVGNWMVDTKSQRPTSLVAIASGIYVGTGQGVWHFDRNARNPKWLSWTADGSIRPALVVGLANMRRTSNNTSYRYANQFRTVNFRREGAAGVDWTFSGEMALGGANTTQLVSVLTARDNEVFVGTLDQGIWKQTWNAANAPGAWQQIVGSPNLGGTPVLSLALDNNILWAGTMGGLFKIDLTPNPITVTAVAVPVNIPPPLWITNILGVDKILLVGTARHGLWGRADPANALTLVLAAIA